MRVCERREKSTMMKDAEKASLTKLYNPFRREKRGNLNESVRLLKREISIIDFSHSFSFIFHPTSPRDTKGNDVIKGHYKLRTEMKTSPLRASSKTKIPSKIINNEIYVERLGHHLLHDSLFLTGLKNCIFWLGPTHHFNSNKADCILLILKQT